MVLQSMAAYLYETYGESLYKIILGNAEIPVTVFNTHDNYPDKYVKALTQSTAEVLSEGKDSGHYLEIFGRQFVKVSFGQGC